MYKTPFSAHISIKNSFAKYYEDIEDPADSACETEKESEKFKIEPTEFDNNSESKEMEKLKSFIEDNLKEIDELKNRNKELETKLKKN